MHISPYEVDHAGSSEITAVETQLPTPSFIFCSKISWTSTVSHISTRDPKINKTWFLISRFSWPILETNMQANSDGTKAQVRRWNMRYGKGNLSLSKQIEEGFLEEATSELRFKGWGGVCQVFKHKKGVGGRRATDILSKENSMLSVEVVEIMGHFKICKHWDCWNI